MKKPVLKKVLLITILTLLIISLCACSKIPGLDLKTIKKVDIKVSDTMTLGEDGTYHMALYSNAYIYLDWHNIQVENPEIKWFKKESDKEYEQLEVIENKLIIDTSKIYLGGLYFYAQVNDIKSNEIKVIIDFAELETQDISSSNFQVENKRIQINQTDFLKSSVTINLESNFNYAYVDPTKNYIACWYVDGAKVMDGNKYSIEILKLDDGEVKRVVNVSYRVYLSDTNFKESTLEIIVLRDYDAIESMKLKVSGASEIRNDKSPYNYVVLDEFKQYRPVTISVDTFPNTSRLYSKARWNLRTKNENKLLDEKGRQVTFIPQHGKNTIRVTIENLRSYSIIIYAFSSKEMQKYDKQIKDQFYWDGNWNDQFISDQLDLNYSVANLMSKHEVGLKQEVYLARDNWVYKGKVTDAFIQFGEYSKGALQYAVMDCGEAGIYRLAADASAFWFVEGTVFSKPKEAIKTNYIVTQEQTVVPTHYSKKPTRQEKLKAQEHLKTNEQDILPIDKCDEMLVTSSDMLFRMASWGYKPIFEDTKEGRKIETIYKNAREVLCEIIDDTMSEVEKVYAIYEWIIYNIDYDYRVTDSDVIENASSSKYHAFYLEGIFLDHRAVCDGRAKAVTLMCSMEGIKSIRVIGEAHGVFGNYLGGHAWNKVFIDPNGDDIREWYVIDTTWGDSPRNKTMDSGVALKYEIIETLSYDYFLKRDRDLSTHKITMHDCPKADTVFMA